ncbi:MAG: hypoxanthine phosphoribosyltransferase [Acidobacteriia bacterium]|nr:hypoxanthine phosphoribosyltransferase [Terriglobia bacterium]
MTQAAQPQPATIVLHTAQIRDRIQQLARQISDDYHGRTLHAVCVLEDGFIFMADLVRELDVPVICQFVKPEHKEIASAGSTATEIFFSPEVHVENAHVLLVQGLLETGITTEFLLRNLLARGGASVKVATLLDRQSARRISLAPDYFGFEVDDRFVFGYGLGSPQLRRNLPYVATSGVAATAVE